MADLDLVNRDPNNINNHLTASFEDVLAEPDGTHSLGCMWKITYHCFSIWKSLCYNLIVILSGSCLAMGWGISFAYVIYVQVWAITPVLRICSILCNPLQKINSMCMSCCIAPLCDSCGMILSNMKLQKA